MKKLVVSDISDTIYLANTKPVKDHPNLIETIGEKQDYTDECIRAVYQWFLNHCHEEKSGMYQIRYGDKPWLTMDLKNPKEQAEQEAHDGQA